MASVIGLLVLVVVVLLVAFRRRSCQRFKTAELATLALLVCLLYVAAIPWQIGLVKVPGLDALVFSIPYTAVLLLDLRLVPKPGAATMLVFGAGIFGQLLGRGLNPTWWPYYLWCGLSVDLYLILFGSTLRSFGAMLGAAVLRGLLAYSYMYLILAPFLWKQFYVWWYIGLKISLGGVGCTVGAWLAWRLAPAIERATRYAAPQWPPGVREANEVCPAVDRQSHVAPVPLPVTSNERHRMSARQKLNRITVQGILVLAGITLMVINKKPDPAVEAEVAVKGFVPLATAKVATLNGPDHLSHNDDGSTYRSVTPAPPVMVQITESAIDAAGPTFRHKFPEHSIMVIELLAKQESK